MPKTNPKTQYMKPVSKMKSISAPLLFAIMVIAAIFLMSVSFRVSNIQVVGNDHYSDEEIVNAIDIEEGDNLFFFDRFAAVSRVFAKLPYIEEVSITRNLPNRVIIEVQESKAMAYIKMGNELWTMDHNCKLLGKAAEGEDTELISVEGFKPGTFYIGETLTQDDDGNDAVNYLTDLLCQIQDRGLTGRISVIDMSDLSKVFLRFDNRYKIILGDSSNSEHKFSMAVAAIMSLKDGDIGILDVSDGVNSKFSPY